MIARALAVVLLVAVCPLTSSLAATCKKSDPALSGFYQLRGVMETGSLIRLLPDGRFNYMLTVGAYDEVAAGCWRRQGKAIRLVPKKFRHGPGGPTFKQLKLSINPAGALVRQLSPKQTGRYVRVRR